MLHPPMRVLVTGGTGFIGAGLCEVLSIEGHDVTVVTRHPPNVVHGRAIGWNDVPAAMGAVDAVINRDLPLIQGIVLLFAAIFTGVNLVVDLTYAALNPKLRHG